MSWNNGKETKIFEKRLGELIEEWKEYGLSEDQIQLIVESEKEEFLSRRRREENGQEAPLWVEDEDEFIHEVDPISLSYEEDICEDDPFQYGFKNECLNKLVAQAGETDLNILRLLSKGLSQAEVARTLGLSHQFVSYRVKRFKKFF